MRLIKHCLKLLFPAIILGIAIYLLYIYLKDNLYFLNFIDEIEGKHKTYTPETCRNSFTQLLVRDTCYVCPEGSQGISWVSPGTVQCSTEHNSVLNAMQK